jgi:hypothetical protein
MCAVKLGLNKEKPKDTTLEVYQLAFEDEFLLATEVYYTAESSAFIENNSVADYMKKVRISICMYRPLGSRSCVCVCVCVRGDTVS